MDYRPPLDGTTVLALFRLGAPDDPIHAILRIHPPLADQAGARVQYRYSMELCRPPGDEPLLFITSEFNRRALEGAGGGKDYFLGVFDRFGHRNLGAAADCGDMTAFTARALDIARKEFAIARADIRPAQKPELVLGGQKRVDETLTEQSTDLLLAITKTLRGD